MSELYPGKVIGFKLLLGDWDPGDDMIAGFLLGESGTSADTYVDGILLGSGGALPEDTAVENASWGRIKAAFGKE